MNRARKILPLRPVPLHQYLLLLWLSQQTQLPDPLFRIRYHFLQDQTKMTYQPVDCLWPEQVKCIADLSKQSACALTQGQEEIKFGHTEFNVVWNNLQSSYLHLRGFDVVQRSELLLPLFKLLGEEFACHPVAQPQDVRAVFDRGLRQGRRLISRDGL